MSHCCQLCVYSTERKWNYDRHMRTKKHANNASEQKAKEEKLALEQKEKEEKLALEQKEEEILASMYSMEIKLSKSQQDNVKTWVNNAGIKGASSTSYAWIPKKHKDQRQL